MFTLNYKYKNKSLLKEWLKENSFASQKECLVQFFSGVATKKMMQTIASTLSDALPSAHIIGSTTDGEISGDSVSEQAIIISVSVFEKSTISSTWVEYSDSSYSMGKEIAMTLDDRDAKAMILFTTGLAINGEEFLDGVRTISHGNYLISGGMAGDNGQFKQTYVTYRDRVIEKGSVGVVLKGSELNVKSHYQFGWEAVGLPMRVTKSLDNRVYELDGVPIIDIYTKYFSEEISKCLPKIGVEIPLILERNNYKIARACIH